MVRPASRFVITLADIHLAILLDIRADIATDVPFHARRRSGAVTARLATHQRCP